MGADPHTRELRLGEIMIERGLLSEQQLAAALAEQRREPRPLGEVLVALGYVSSAAVSEALAEQNGWARGGDFGLGDRLERHLHAVPAQPPPAPDPGALAAEPAPEPTPVPADAEAERNAAAAADAARPALDESANDGADSVPAVGADPQAPANDLDTIRSHADEQAAEPALLGRELAASDHAGSNVDVAGGGAQDTIPHRGDAPIDAQEPIQTEEAEPERRAEAEDEPGQAERELRRLRTQHRRDLKRIGALQEQLEAGEAERARLRHELAQARRAATGSRRAPPEDETHKLFVPTASGYELLERRGPAPELGTAIELNDGDTVTRYHVSKLAPPPLPGASGVCAYLQPS